MQAVYHPESKQLAYLCEIISGERKNTLWKSMNKRFQFQSGYNFSPTSDRKAKSDVLTCSKQPTSTGEWEWSVTHQCCCCRCEPWCRPAEGSSPSPRTPCRRPGSSRLEWLAGSCGCAIGSTLASAGQEAPSCPENGNGNP